MKTKSISISWSRTSVHGYGDLTLGGAELDVDVSKAVRNMEVVGRARKVFDCPRVLKGCFNAYIFSSLEYCIPVRMSSAKSRLCMRDSIVHSAERLCEGELCCLGHRRKVSASCLLYEIYHRVDHPMNEYLNNFVAARNTRASAALYELDLVIPRCRMINAVGRLRLLLSVCGACYRRAFLMVAHRSLIGAL